MKINIHKKVKMDTNKIYSYSPVWVSQICWFNKKFNKNFKIE